MHVRGTRECSPKKNSALSQAQRPQTPNRFSPPRPLAARACSVGYRTATGIDLIRNVIPISTILPVPWHKGKRHLHRLLTGTLKRPIEYRYFPSPIEITPYGG